MANKANFIVYDTETTGLDPNEGAEIVQIAAVCVDARTLEIDLENSFNSFIKPQNPDKASPEALRVIGPVWDRALEEGLDPKSVFKKYISWVEDQNSLGQWYSKPIRVGHNVSFDNKMTEYWFEYYGVLNPKKLPWNFRSVDTQDQMFNLFESDLEMDNYKLDTCCAKIGIGRSSDFHDAYEDVMLTAEIFQRYMKFMRSCRQRIKMSV